jgi:hypothetical protein
LLSFLIAVTASSSGFFDPGPQVGPLDPIEVIRNG